jgi:hypothetical protein
MKYFLLSLLLILNFYLSAQESNFGAVTVFNSVSCGDSTLNIIPIGNVGDQPLTNAFVVREVFNEDMVRVFQDSSIVADISQNNLYSFEMYLYGENIDKDGNYFIRFTFFADADLNDMTVTPDFNLKVTKCCKIALINFSEVSCNGFSDGSLEIEGYNGTPPYSYFWSEGSNGQKISDLGPGQYSIIMYDASICIAKDTFEIFEPEEILANIITQDESKVNAKDGTAESIPTGGDPPYSFSWSTGATTPDIVDLPPGDYSLTVTDASECQAIFFFNIDQYMCELKASVQGPSILCPGESALCTAMGMDGKPPYSYVWDTGNNTEAISISAGMYNVTVSDSEGCTASASIDIDEFPPIIVDTTEIIDATSGLEDGAIYIDVFGGTPPYVYFWYRDSMVVSMEEDLIDFQAGDYTLTVVDYEGCAVGTDTITIGTITSIKELKLSLEIYPVPAQDYLTFNSVELWRGEIYDIKGNRILQIPKTQKYTWTVTDQAAGIYYARIIIDDQIYFKKIVVSKSK